MASATGRADVPARPRDGRCALGLFLLFLAFYLLTTSGHFYAIDEETLYGMTESIVERHNLALPPGLWFISDYEAAFGPVYAPYMPGQPLAAVPLYLLGRAVAPLFPADAAGYVTRFFVSLFGSFVTAATVALLFALARALGYRRAAVGVAAAYGLATMAWPHGRTFFAEPFTALWLLAAFFGICRGARAGGWRRAGWCAGAAVAAVAALGVKPHAAVALPFLGLYLLAASVAPPPGDAGRGARARGAAWALGGWGAGLALLAGPLALYNTARYGGPLRTGYGARPLAVLDPAAYPTFAPEGLFGLVLSTGKGLLWYAPPVILALGALWPFARRHRAEALTCLAILLANVWFYSRLPTWHGDGSWGPRLLTIALPFAVLPLVELLERLPGRRALTVLVAVVLAAGVAVQGLGVLVNFDWYILRSDEGARHFAPAASPILWHARLLGARLGEARRWLPQPGTAVLSDGFSAREGGAGGAILPRWTTGDGLIALHPRTGGAALVTLTFFDHRPPALRTGMAEVLVDGVPLPAGAVERRDVTGTGEGWTYQFAVPAGTLAAGGATIALRSATWNPKAAGQGGRDEDIGLFLHGVEVRDERGGWAVGEALSPPPLPRTPRARFWWFNDDRPPDETRHQLLDHWAWYASVAGFPRAVAQGWIAGYTAACLLATGLGLAALRPFLRRTARRRRRVGRRRAGARAAGR